MKLRFLAIASVAVSLLCTGTLLYGGSQDSKARLPAPATNTSNYPESESGLKNYLQDMLDAAKSGDQGIISSHLANLAIPDHDAWFVNIFGPDEGHRLELKYEELLPDFPNKFSQRLNRALEGQKTNIKISIFQNPVDPSAKLAHAIGEAMVQPIPFYSADAMSADQQSSTYLGYFVYVGGTFHYVDPEEFRVLSTVPPLRVRQGSKVTAASILRQAPPIYPDEAMRTRVQGDVVLHVIVGTDGTVKKIELVSGDSLLVAAAIDAVKQWRYSPTLLDGTPVEVDTTITVSFRFNK